MARNTGRERQMYKGQGKEEHGANPLEPIGEWNASQRRKGGGQSCGQRMHVEVGKDPRTGEPLGLTGTWAQDKYRKGGET